MTAAGLPAGPVCAADGTLSGTAKILPAGKSFLRQLPFALADDDSGAPAGYRSPLVVVDVNGAGKWIPVDRLAEHEIPATSMAVRVLDGWPAFNVRATPNYMLGSGHFTAGPTYHFKAIADYEDIYATMAWYSDEIFRVNKSTGAGGYGGTLYIDVPEAQCWYRLANTMTDANGAKQVTAAAGELRRDVDLLSGVAAMAAAWYGRDRAAIILRKDNRCDFDLGVGTFITSLTYTPAKTVNTLITEVTHNFDNQTTTIKTDFRELDYAGIGRALNSNNQPGPKGPAGDAGPDGPDGPGDGNLGDERSPANGPGIPGFWAEITGSATDGNANRFKYAWAEVYKASAGYDGWSTLSGGRSGTTSSDPARNSAEDMNTVTGGNELGCGVAVNSLDTADWTFTVSPAASGVIVWMTEVNRAGTTEYWFTHENGIDGSCD